MTSLNVAEAKKMFSDLLGRVAYGGESILITRRGKPMAKLVPIAPETPRHLDEVEGWLDDEDSFFTTIDEIVEARSERVPRALASDMRSRNT